MDVVGTAGRYAKTMSLPNVRNESRLSQPLGCASDLCLGPTGFVNTDFYNDKIVSFYKCADCGGK